MSADRNLKNLNVSKTFGGLKGSVTPINFDFTTS